MCINDDGSYTIPSAGKIPSPIDRKTLKIIHDTMFHVDEVVLVELIAAAYNDLNRIWLHFRKEMYAVHGEEIFSEEQYKDAMLYIIVACSYAGQLDGMLDLAARMREMG